jgi:hypothetical protein
MTKTIVGKRKADRTSGYGPTKKVKPCLENASDNISRASSARAQDPVWVERRRLLSESSLPLSYEKRYEHEDLGKMMNFWKHIDRIP